MNNKRRTKVNKAITMINQLNIYFDNNYSALVNNDNNYQTLINVINRSKDLYKDVEKILDEEQLSFDNLTEGLQCTRRGMAIEDNISVLEDCLELFDTLIDMMEEMKNKKYYKLEEYISHFEECVELLYEVL